MTQKSRLLSLALVLAVVLFSTSCRSRLGSLDQNNFIATPSPLETVGVQVPVAISGTFPERWFHRNAIVTITPVLKFAGGEVVAGTSHSFQGESVSGNRTVITNRRGGNFTMNASFPWQPEMLSSELYLRFEARIGNRQAALPDLKIADGVLATSALASVYTTSPSVAPDGFQRIIQDMQEANIMFIINQANLRQSELNSHDLAAWKRRVEQAFNDPRQNVEVEISAYASPDGPLAFNERLAAQRERNTSQFLDRSLRNRNVATDINAHFTAEDWEGFRQLVAASNLQDRDLILRVLEMNPDPVVREREIRNFSVVFQELAETILPQLRRSRIIANFELIGRSDDEILDYWRNRPRELSVEELLYASTLTHDGAEVERIYQFVTAHFPQDYRGWNNMGTLFYRQGEFANARQAFERASQIAPAAPEVNMNMALLAMADRDLATATELLGRSAGAAGLEEAMGLYNLMQGNYSQAVSAFGSARTNNAALAQLLVRDYNRAQTTLSIVDAPDATTAYLLAIIAARTNNFSDVLSNLRTAINLDRSMAQHALNDLEFLPFRTNQEFIGLLR
jgi:tetratricopeptide (TPR) repeat protein